MTKTLAALIVAACTIAVPFGAGTSALADLAGHSLKSGHPDDGPLIPIAQRRTCKSVSSCREAVKLWCDGYRRADADGDGIPCENVCHTKKQVDAIRKEIGC